jgi:hypothetical protein
MRRTAGFYPEGRPRVCSALIESTILPRAPAWAVLYRLRMTADDLTPEQLAWFQAVVGRHLRFYGRLRTRMEKRRFRGDDPLYINVSMAFNAVHALHVELHYLHCTPGTVGRLKLELPEGETPGWIRAREQSESPDTAQRNISLPNLPNP